MRCRTIIYIGLVWLLFFSVAKTVFALCCGEAAFSEIVVAICHGFTMDMSTVGYFLTVPMLVVWVSIAWPNVPLRRVLSPWHALCAVLASAAVVADVSLYPFWQFKLDATILNYIDSPADAVASVSMCYIVWRILLFLILAVAMTCLLCRITPKHFQRVGQWKHVLMPIYCGLLFVTIRGGVDESTMNVGVAYHSQRMFLNHVAVNPLFSFIASIGKAGNYAEEFNILPENECKQEFQKLYTCQIPAATYRNSDYYPNVLIILWESAGGAFFAPFGGEPGVTENLEVLANEGVLFSEMYCNSWRTDRGMVSALSGWFAYPTLTLMRLPVICDRLPCLGRSFARQGYDTFFLYGGDINFTHTAGYLTAGGYRELISDKDFSMRERNTEQWGVTDSITFDRLFDEVVARSHSGRPWHGGMLTLSSHAPFDVPYHKLQDPVLNAMAYTDHCLGRFIDRLKAEKDVWQNLLVVILPDHGYPYDNMSYTHPLFFHAPMVWTGGFVNEPQVVDRLMNQSDMPATLLGAVGIPHDDYPYSRDVLDSAYTYPFAYSVGTEFLIFSDSAGRTVFNVKTLQEVEGGDACRLKRLKAILQSSYDIIH